MGDSAKNKKISYLGSTGLFSGFSSSELTIIAQNSSFRKFRKGERIFSSGKTARQLFVIEYGEVVISKYDDEKRNIDIARFLKGDCFGELDMLTDSVRNASATADSDTRLLVFPGKGILFRDMLETYPEISARILHKFLVQIAERIRKANALVSENSPLIQELSRQVYRDKLTDLYNKTYLEERLKEILSSCNDSVSLIMVKPDNFKLINDSYGHEAGDQALRIMAASFTDFLPQEYTIFRFMGNELAVLLPQADRDKAFSKAVEIKEFMNNLDLKRACEGSVFNLSVSIGISVYPEHAVTSEELIQKAHELPLIGRGMGGNKILFPEDVK